VSTEVAEEDAEEDTGVEDQVPKNDHHSAPHGQAPIYKLYAQRCGAHGFVYHGLERNGKTWEKLIDGKAWVEKNFGQYGDWLEKVRAMPGKPFVVPQGRAAGTSAELTMANDGAPLVVRQADRPLCASLGLVSALRFAGYCEHAQRLEDCAVELSGYGTHQAKAAVQKIHDVGGWARVDVLSGFLPIVNRSPHVTVVQLCAVNAAGNEDSTHVVAIVGDWICDSNYASARQLSQASLDACCVGEGWTFKRVSYAARFVPGKALRKALRRSG